MMRVLCLLALLLVTGCQSPLESRSEMGDCEANCFILNMYIGNDAASDRTVDTEAEAGFTEGLW